MEFLGLTARQLFTLFAIAGGAIVVLYILKLRRRRVAVPYSRLWEKVLVDRPTSSLFSQLKRILSLLVQLALLSLMVFALADPRVRNSSPTGRNLVVLIDGSASMKATDVPGSRAQAARDAVRRMIREMGSSDRMLLAQMDAEITPLSPMTDDVGALEGALREYEPHDTGMDFARALRFALDASRGMQHAEVIVVGDGGYGPARDSGGEIHMPAGTALRHVSIGRSGRNVGISAFSARRYPLDKSRYEVLVEVRNYSDHAERVELTLSADGAPLEVTQLALEANGSAQRVLADQSGANQTLEARVTFADGTHDDLPADDHAYATLPARRRARVLAVGPDNLYLGAALLLNEYLDVHDASPADAPRLMREQHWDVVIEDNVVVPTPAGTNVLYLNPSGPDSPLVPDAATPEAALVRRPFFDRIDTRHPLMRWMSDLEDTNIGVATRFRLQPGDRALAASTMAPLLIAGERNGARFVALAFDIRNSDLPLRVSWPVLVINSIDWFAGEDPAYLSSFKTGETWRIPVAPGVDTAEIETPTGRHLRVPVIEGRAVTHGVQAGFYRLRAGDDSQIIAGNLVDPDESHCAPQPRLDVNGAIASAPVAGRVGVRREIWIYLLAAALGIIVIEWVTYHRRVTV
jgi:hypothetical protein